MPIELDLTPEERRAQIIRNCGAKPDGEKLFREGAPESLAYFTDPITKSTLALFVDDVTEENVRNKLAESRLKYGFAIVETAVKNNMELFEKLKAMLKSLEDCSDLPESVVISAANAATMEIVAYRIANTEENFPSPLGEGQGEVHHAA